MTQVVLLGCTFQCALGDILMYLYIYIHILRSIYIPPEVYTCRYIKFGFGFWDSSLSRVLFNLQNYLPIP